MADVKIGNQKSTELSGVKPARAQTIEEREAELVAREERLMALESRVLANMERMERLERLAKGEPVEDAKPARAKQYDADGKEIPWFDKDMPYGLVQGDHEARYTQDGHLFGPDGQYLRDEPRGTGRPFDIRLLGRVIVPKAA